MGWGCESNSEEYWGDWLTVKLAGTVLTRPCCCVPHRLHVAVSPRSRSASVIYWLASHTPLVVIGGARDHAHRLPTAFERMNMKAEEKVGKRQCLVVWLIFKTGSSWQLKYSDDFTPILWVDHFKNQSNIKVSLSKVNPPLWKYWRLKLTILSITCLYIVKFSI